MILVELAGYSLVVDLTADSEQPKIDAHGGALRVSSSMNTHAARARSPAQSRSLFLVGAPRCGTTSLGRFLADHPQICRSKPKETHFFLRECLDDERVDYDRSYIGRYFPNLNGQHSVICDGSVSYLYSQPAINRILRFDPEARFIAIVRNPVDLVHSYHSRLWFTMDEDVSDFSVAWSLQDARARGENIPKRCRDPRLLQYGQVGCLGSHVESLFATAGREKCRVFVFEDLIADPAAVYGTVLDLIQLEHDGRTDFPRKNYNKGFKHHWIQQFVMNPPRPVARFLEMRARRGRVRIPQSFRVIRKRLKKMNTFEQEREPLSREMRGVLEEFYRSDVVKLSDLLGRDLTHWVKA